MLSISTPQRKMLAIAGEVFLAVLVCTSPSRRSPVVYIMSTYLKIYKIISLMSVCDILLLMFIKYMDMCEYFCIECDLTNADNLQQNGVHSIEEPTGGPFVCYENHIYMLLY
jgi:hypothetical protein